MSSGNGITIRSGYRCRARGIKPLRDADQHLQEFFFGTSRNHELSVFSAASRGDFEKVNDKLYRGTSLVTALRPIIEEAIDREIKRNPRLEGEAVERKIANRLTNLNNFSQLQESTQEKLIEMTGIDFHAMSKQERERTINHLQHSPVPFGSIESVLTPDTVIDLGFTHTLDKKYTRVGYLGDGVWKV